jgi:hypothetical protein
MPSETSAARGIKEALAHAQSVHEQSAACHDAAAAIWDVRDEAERADFERRCAALERELAQIEADRITLVDARSRWQTDPDLATLAEIERRAEEIMRRVSRLRADDDALERRRPGRERDAERAEPLAMDMSERLSSTLSRVAEALEESAILAEAHAQRQKEAGRANAAAEERRIADRAHAAARRARQNAERWLELGADRNTLTSSSF